MCLRRTHKSRSHLGTCPLERAVGVSSDAAAFLPDEPGYKVTLLDGAESRFRHKVIEDRSSALLRVSNRTFALPEMYALAPALRSAFSSLREAEPTPGTKSWGIQSFWLGFK